MGSAIFHLSVHVDDLAAARTFYVGLLGCAPGRSAETWLDVDFFGHQLSLHRGVPVRPQLTGSVEGIPVPMPHFGAILPLSEWQALVARLRRADAAFLVEPGRRFSGQPGEQWTFFLADPAGNAIELKAFGHTEEVFSK